MPTLARRLVAVIVDALQLEASRMPPGSWFRVWCHSGMAFGSFDGRIAGGHKESSLRTADSWAEVRPSITSLRVVAHR